MTYLNTKMANDIRSFTTNDTFLITNDSLLRMNNYQNITGDIIQTTLANLSNMDTLKYCYRDPQYRMFRIAIELYAVLVLCIGGITGNIVSIVVLGRDRVVRRTTGFLLQALAFTDILYLTTCLFFQFLHVVEECTEWLPGLYYYWPQMEPYVWPCASIAQTATVWLVVVVTSDRYVAICRPLHAPQYSTMSRMRKAVIGVMVLSIIYNLPRFFERTVEFATDPKTNQRFPVVNKTDLREDTTYVVLYKTFLYFIVRFFIPLSSLAFFNTRLIQAIRKSYQQHQSMPGDYLHHRREKYSMTLVVVVVVFIICETPDFFLRIWQALHVFFDNKVSFPKAELLYVNLFSNLFLTINSCSNFVIYCFMGTRFRRIMIKLLCKTRSSRQTDSFQMSANWNTTHHRTTCTNTGEEHTNLVSQKNRYII